MNIEKCKKKVHVIECNTIYLSLLHILIGSIKINFFMASSKKSYSFCFCCLFLHFLTPTLSVCFRSYIPRFFFSSSSFVLNTLFHFSYFFGINVSSRSWANSIYLRRLFQFYCLLIEEIWHEECATQVKSERCSWPNYKSQSESERGKRKEKEKRNASNQTWIKQQNYRVKLCRQAMCGLGVHWKFD